MAVCGSPASSRLSWRCWQRPPREPAAQSGEPFFAVGPWYPSPDPATAPERERWIGELRAIKAAGFNSIRLPVEWRTTEPERGPYRFDRIGDLLTTAG